MEAYDISFNSSWNLSSDLAMYPVASSGISNAFPANFKTAALISSICFWAAETSSCA